MRYLVVVQRDVTNGEIEPQLQAVAEDSGDHPWGGDPDEVHHQEVCAVIACETTREVAKAVRENPGWTVWEVTPRGIRQRAIVQKRDGGVCYDVEIS
jgi:hypothetical protein